MDASVNTPAVRARRGVCVLVAAVVPFLSSLFYFVIFSESALAQAIYSGTKLFTLIWPFVVYRYLLRVKLPTFPLLRRADQGVVWGVASGLAVSILLVGLYLSTALGDVVVAAAPAIRAKATTLGILGYYVPFAIFLACFHSLIEEYYWRWFVYGEIRGLIGNGFRAHLLAALAFSLHHMVIATQFFPLLYGLLFGLSVGVGGVLWSALYEKTNSLLGSWISHIIVDLCILGVGYNLIIR